MNLLCAGALAAVCALSPLGTLPPDATDGAAQQPAAARLGQYLFFDPRLSVNGKISCASCHQPARAFTAAGRWQRGSRTGRATSDLLDPPTTTGSSGTGVPTRSGRKCCR